MSVGVFDYIFQTHLHVHLSQGFSLDWSFASSSSNARSTAIRSHTVRPSIRLGFGIRPSCTKASNFVMPIPMYSAASARLNPRRNGAGQSSNCVGRVWFTGLALSLHFGEVGKPSRHRQFDGCVNVGMFRADVGIIQPYLRVNMTASVGMVGQEDKQAPSFVRAEQGCFQSRQSARIDVAGTEVITSLGNCLHHVFVANSQ